MRAVFFIGNGFDLNLNLETSFPKFLEYYLKQKADSSPIIALKKNIQKNISTWGDLEKRLGEYTSEVETPEDMIECLIDISDSLCDYLENIEKIFPLVNIIDVEKFKKELFTPYRYLYPSELSQLNSVISSWQNKIELSVFTFNYTKILSDILKEIDIYKTGQNTFVLKEILHIHGKVHMDTILGVNDVEQIKNVEFRKNEEILNLLVKSNSRIAVRNNVHNKALQIFKNAMLIYLFGSSINDTDKEWWHQIGLRLISNAKLIIFHFDSRHKKSTQTHRERNYENKIKLRFIKKTGLDEKHHRVMKNNIYIVVNSTLFNDIYMGAKSVTI